MTNSKRSFQNCQSKSSKCGPIRCRRECVCTDCLELVQSPFEMKAAQLARHARVSFPIEGDIVRGSATSVVSGAKAIFFLIVILNNTDSLASTVPASDKMAMQKVPSIIAVRFAVEQVIQSDLYPIDQNVIAVG